MVSRLPAAHVGLVPGGTRATLILALFCVATSLGLPFLEYPMFPGQSLACSVLFISHLPLVKSRKPAFHVSQDGLLLRRSMHIGYP